MAASRFHDASNWLSEVYASKNSQKATCYALLGAGALLTVYLIRRKRGANRGVSVPGPWLPPSMRTDETDVKQMEELMKKYGPIFGFQMLSMKIVFLCDVSCIKEALVGQGDVFAGRMHSSFISFINKDCGLIFIDGPKWQEHRRFVLTVLRSFGFGKNVTERIIQDELAVLLNEFAKSGGKPMFPRMPLISSVANVISSLVFGERCCNDPDFDLMVKLTTDAVSNSGLNNLVAALFFRVILLLPGDYFGIKKAMADIKALMAFVFRKTDEHRRTIDWDNERDLIDAYLVEMRKRDAETPNNHSFTDFQLFRVVFELFIAGMETTSTTLTWAMLLMAMHPDVQRRVQAEIDSVIGEKPPQYSDRSKLTYAAAVLHEVERFTTLVPFSVPHATTGDTTLRGYFIPSGTIVMPYLFAAHRDPRLWKNPKVFDPSHFYDESSKSLVNTQNLIPFSVGKRACLGESLAAQELFVFFTGVLQRYRIEADPSHPLPEIEEKILNSTVRMSPEYKVCITDRVKT